MPPAREHMCSVNGKCSAVSCLLNVLCTRCQHFFPKEAVDQRCLRSFFTDDLLEFTWRVAIVSASFLTVLNLIVVRQLAELDLNHLKLQDACVENIKGL